jgi:hypothetical protein
VATLLLGVFLLWIGISELTNIEVVWMDVISQFCALLAGVIMLALGATRKDGGP